MQESALSVSSFSMFPLLFWIPAGTGCQRLQVKIKAEDTASGIPSRVKY